MAKFEFDITTGLDRFVEMAQNRGFGARKVADAGPSGWPIVEIVGEEKAVYAFVSVYYDPDMSFADMIDLHEVK